MTNSQDGGLRDLFVDAVAEANAIIGATRGAEAPLGSSAHLWRWAIIYLVLAADLGDSALVLSDGHHNRALLILRRVMFEHMVRFKFYRKHEDVASSSLEDFDRLAKRFWTKLGDESVQILKDNAFDTVARESKKHNLYEIMTDVFSDRADDLYARFYIYPSAIIHGDALSSIDVVEMDSPSTIKLHSTSRRSDTNRDVLFNYLAFLIKILVDASRELGVRLEHAITLTRRLTEVRRALGIELDL